MAYVLYALIGAKEILEEGAREFEQAHVVPLNHGIAMIPVTDELCFEVGGVDPAEAFYRQAGGVSQSNTLSAGGGR